MSQPFTMRPHNDPILMHFRSALNGIFGDRIERLLLFGARVRGDSYSDSNYDIAVFLNDYTERREEARRLVHASQALIFERSGSNSQNRRIVASR